MRPLLPILLSALTLCASAVTLDFSVDGMRFAWQPGDKVGFLPEQGTQIRFGLTEIAEDLHCATTTGYGWALKEGAAYYAYAPYRSEYSVRENTATALPLSFLDQQQVGNDNTAHLTHYAFFCGKLTAHESETNLLMEPRTSVVRISEKFDRPMQMSRIVLSAGANSLPLTGQMNLITGHYEPLGYSSSVVLDMQDVSVMRGEEMVAYLTLPPCNLKGRTLTITFVGNDGTTYETTHNGFEIREGETYCIGTILAPTRADFYFPTNDGTRQAPVLIGLDLPIGGSFFTTDVKHPTLAPSASGEAASLSFDLSGRRATTATRGITIKNHKMTIRE